MSSVSYGSYNFPTPLPAIAESVEPIFIAGNFDHSKVKIDVAGFITGENAGGLLKAKKAMVDGLSSSFGQPCCLRTDDIHFLKTNSDKF